MKSGIYIIRNTVNDKVYIGSTVDVNARWQRHISLNHTCYKLKNAMAKHGTDKFYWEWLEPLDISELTKSIARQILLEREQFYLDTLKPFFGRGYNISPTAGSPLGAKHKPGLKRRAYKHTQSWFDKVTGENSKKNKPVTKYTTNGQVVQEYFNVSSASDDTTGATIQAIIKCCNSKQKTAGGYCWAYAGDTWIAPSPHKSKRVSAYDLSGCLVNIYRNAKEAAVELGKLPSPIYRCCRGELDTAYGFVWKWDPA